ncbi:latent-transforming growth factor beta-binding protein 4 isoform X2 [Esox lucius]|uniref:latent-transforming growth factor beta-binding protein 4 isoform X2 n=1 Tax=Esox lucius TaxID=8010 RepID=UPI001476BE2C|nr:latent-transforming growth factor beta-binding protein 4 isoform X2 [Esox lucius]
MPRRRYAHFLIVGVTFILCLTFSKSDGTLGKRATHKRVQDIQRETASRYYHGTVNYQVYHTQWRTTTSKPTLKQKQSRFKGQKHWKHGANMTIYLNGPNICGDRCCLGWTISSKTQKCTKPRCLPRCHNRAVCRQPNICECRPGFSGARCEFASVSYGLVGHPGPFLRPTSPMFRTPTLPPSTPVSPSSTTLPTSLTLQPSTPVSPSSTTLPTSLTLQPSTPVSPSSTTLPTSLTLQPSTPVSPSSTTLPTSLTLQPSTPVSPSPTTLVPSETLAAWKTSASATKPETRTHYTGRGQPLILKESQSLLLKKALARSGHGDKMTTILMKYIEAESKKLRSASSLSGSQTTSVKHFHTQKGQYTVHFKTYAASNQTTGLREATGIGGGRGAERIKVLFTPTICKVRCTNGRCTNFCERGNMTTLYNSDQGQASLGPGFRVFLCPMLCQNGGVCIQKDRCLCPPTFTGKFCHIPVATPSTNDIEKPPPSPSVLATQQLLTQSEYLLPLHSQQQSHGVSGSSMVKVRVRHPPEASVKIHQVLKVGYGPGTDREQPETVTRSAGLSGARAGLLPGERAEAPPPKASVQAQTLRGDSIHTEASGFKYCFREVRNGQCSSPLPGLRSQDTCCRGIGLAWGINQCVLCPANTGGGVNGSCPAGFNRINGTQCVDVNECLQPGFCENGNCVNTRGSYSCVCRQGYILDASHGICVSHKVISEDKGQCYRILTSGSGPGSCSVPILRNITKQICCCSRVGKAWGKTCERCPYFGSVAFKEICPAGPGYHYSSSAIKFNQRVLEQLGTGGPPVISQSTPQTQAQGAGNARLTTQPRPQQPSRGASLPHEGGAHTPASAVPQLGPRTQTNRTPVRPSPITARPPITRPVRGVCDARPQVCGQGSCVDLPAGRHTCVCNQGYQLNALQTQCQDIDECRTSRPPCGSGRCHNTDGGYRCTCPSGYQPGAQSTSCIDVDECLWTPRPCSEGTCVNTAGSYRCVCLPGYRANFQQTLCQDVDECRQVPNPCFNSRCENSPGSFRCVCRTGYKLEGNTCTDVNECADPLRCPGQACVNSPGSYRCISCPPGFGILNEQCTDIDECRQNPGPCSNGRCENTPGSYRCVCAAGYKLLGQTCTDVDECGQIPGPCTDGHCENSQGSYSCTCPAGYRLQGDVCADVDECADPSQCPGQECANTRGSYACVSCRPGFGLVNRRCTDVDECLQKPPVCPSGRCQNTAGSYQCACRSGYRLHGGICTDVDECENALQCPGQECVNTEGSFKCVPCRPGFEGGRGGCHDIDECRQTPFPCTNGRCENTPGSYQCVCRSGFKLEDSACIDINECEEPSQCPGQQCVNSVGSYKCIACKVGHSLQNGVCSDVDECQVPDTCGTDRLCVNTDGSYRCDCKPGFRTGGHGRQCRDINECLEGDFCFPKGECVNTVGSYQCVCSQGYTTSSNGSSCLDVDECARFGQGLCPDGRCINTEGSYQCKCQVGFTTNPEKTACLDVDECVDSKGAVCVSQRCANTIGSYRCFTSCEPGYRVTPNGECVDINECANMTVCGENAFCQNLIGTYQCVCDQGYTATSDGKACVDEDECVTMQDVCGTARCENADGSFTCECPREGEEFDTRSGQCQPARPLFPGGPSHSGPQRRPGVPQVSQLPLARPGELRECYYNMAEQRSCSVLARNVTWQECCCTVGQGWGLACQYDPCPRVGTADYQALCPSGHGYVTGPGAFSYRDVDECKLFHPEMCKRGVCVNNIPGYSCYCHIGYYHDTELLECVDFNECDSVEDRCPGGVCVNVLGSYYCKCEPPLVLDDTQRSCVNSTVGIGDDELSFCWEHVTDDLVCQSPLLRLRATYTFCCCLYGEAWGLQCALCPTRGSEEFATLCNVGLERYGSDPGPGRGGGGGYHGPYGPDSFSDPVPPRPDYDDYTPAGAGSRSGFRGRTPSSYTVPERPYRPPSGYNPERYYDEDQYGPPDAPQRPPLRTLPDPRSERAFGVRPPPPIPEGLPLSLAPLPDSDPYSDEEEGGPEPWRAGPPFSDRQGPGAGPWGAFERRYEPYASLSTEDCGILHGCENGRCIRVAEGYTCDCFEGYELDMTSMTCIDINECQDPDDVCVNGRCVNTDGSYRCVCHRGYVMSRRPGHCVAA